MKRKLTIGLTMTILFSYGLYTYFDRVFWAFDIMQSENYALLFISKTMGSYILLILSIISCYYVEKKDNGSHCGIPLGGILIGVIVLVLPFFGMPEIAFWSNSLLVAISFCIINYIKKINNNH